jgi:hypothetical protein
MHLTDEQLNEYLDRETIDRTEIESHLSACEDCAARLTALRELFSKIESLPDLALPAELAARLSPHRSLPTQLPRSLTLTVIMQAALTVLTVIVAAPFIERLLAPYFSNLAAPSLADLFVMLQTQWRLWLDLLVTFQVPAIPEIPLPDASSLLTSVTVISLSLLWLIGNGLLLRKQMK